MVADDGDGDAERGELGHDGDGRLGRVHVRRDGGHRDGDGDGERARRRGVVHGARRVPAGPSNIAVVTAKRRPARATQPLAAPFVVPVTDNARNPVANATIAWAAVNGTVASPTTTTDATGQSSNTLTLGTVAGAATATATVGGKSVTFTATAQPGIVAQAQFKVGPPAGAPGVVLAPAIQVALLDAQGNLTAAVNAVTLALGANPGARCWAGR